MPKIFYFDDVNEVIRVRFKNEIYLGKLLKHSCILIHSTFASFYF